MKSQPFPKRYTFQWWQLILYELALFSLGFGIGGLWPDIAARLAPYTLFIFVLIAPYIFFLYLRQINNDDNSTHYNHNDDNERSNIEKT